jgi:hypothetical protein
MELEIENSEMYLKGLPVEGGFAVPTSYFEELENELLAFAETDEYVMDGVSSGSFEVPEGYFDQLNERIIAEIVEEKVVKSEVEEMEGKIISLFGRPVFMRVIGIAASLILVSGLYFFQPKSTQNGIASQVELGVNEVADHIEASELDEDLLCDAGWCNELDGLMPEKDQKGDDSYLELEEDLIIDEL